MRIRCTCTVQCRLVFKRGLTVIILANSMWLMKNTDAAVPEERKSKYTVECRLSDHSGPGPMLDN